MAITDLVAIPKNINKGVSPAKQLTMLSLLGKPRDTYGQDCRPVTSPVLSALIITDNVGPFRITGLAPAVKSLKNVFIEIKQQEPEVYAKLGNAGMLCARNVRGSSTSISNHSWGTAIDLTLNGKLDQRGDNKVQVGLTRIANIFNAHGWFWGAGFGTEDAMHFEVSDEKIREWYAVGMFGKAVQQSKTALSLGDRGSEVIELQNLLNKFGAKLTVDGDFGRKTSTAVMTFQTSKKLNANGIVCDKTWEALKK